jgi:preprotein translocase subunit YajC
VTSFVVAMASPNGQPPGWFQFLPFAIILGIFYFLILMPMKRRQKKIQEFQDALKVGDRVVTTSGMYGQITRVSDKSVQVQVADKVRIEFSRQAIGGYQGQEPVVPPEGSNA